MDCALPPFIHWCVLILETLKVRILENLGECEVAAVREGGSEKEGSTHMAQRKTYRRVSFIAAFANRVFDNPKVKCLPEHYDSLW